MKSLLLTTLLLLFLGISPCFAQIKIPGAGGGTGGTNPDAPGGDGGGEGQIPPGGVGGGIGGEDGCSKNIWCLIIATVIQESTKRLSVAEKRKELKKQWAIEVYEQIEKKLQQLNFDKIVDFLKENKEYFEEFYNNLKEAKTSYQVWKKVIAIVDKQASIVSMYSNFWELGSNLDYFNEDELSAFAMVIDQIFKESQDNVDQLWTVVKTLTDDQMRDSDRLTMVDAIEKRVDKNHSDIRELKEFVTFISTQRKINNNSTQIKKLYGID